MEILDPTDLKVCDTYAEYRRQLSQNHMGSSDHRWSTKYVRIESYASVVAAAWYQRNFALHVHLGLRNVTSTFRYDLSSSLLIISNEDPKASAMKASSQSSFYRRFDDELRRSFEQTKGFDMKQVVDGMSKAMLKHDTLSWTDVKQLLETLGLLTISRQSGLDGSAEETLSDEDFNVIAAKALSEPNAEALNVRSPAAAKDPYPREPS
jgi:hypothetical protein